MRIGNGAHEQLQLDVFGETADAIFQALEAGHGAIGARPSVAAADSGIFGDRLAAAR